MTVPSSTALKTSSEVSMYWCLFEHYASYNIRPRENDPAFLFLLLRFCCLKVTVVFCNSELIVGKNTSLMMQNTTILCSVSLLLLVAFFSDQLNTLKSGQVRDHFIFFLPRKQTLKRKLFSLWENKHSWQEVLCSTIAVAAHLNYVISYCIGYVLKWPPEVKVTRVIQLKLKFKTKLNKISNTVYLIS